MSEISAVENVKGTMPGFLKAEKVPHDRVNCLDMVTVVYGRRGIPEEIG